MQEIDVYALPSEIEPSRLKGSAAVVIDVLRATTVVIHAIAAGARAVVPLLDVEEAERRRGEFATGTVLLGGERQGVMIDGFDLANSPSSYTAARVRGKTVLFTTTNGTVAMHAALGADTILPAGFVNAQAVVERLRNEDRIVIVCAGTDRVETEEDLLLAGCLASRLSKLHDVRLNERAERVRTHWENCSSIPLAELLRKSRGGKNLVELGLDADIVDAARIDSIDVVPRFDPISGEFVKYTGAR